MHIVSDTINWKSSLCFFVLILSAPIASGALINPSAKIAESGYNNIINGLEWLDLDQTNGLSVHEALALNPEYRIATESEFHAMFNLFGAGTDSKFLGNDVYSTLHYQSQGLDRHRDNIIVSNTSSTTFNSFESVFNQTQHTMGSNRMRSWSLGLYQDEDGILRYGGTYVNGYFRKLAQGDEWEFSGELVEIYDDTFDRTGFWGTSGNYNIGTFLVREVPEPVSILLLAIGFVGIRMTRNTGQ